MGPELQGEESLKPPARIEALGCLHSLQLHALDAVPRDLQAPQINSASAHPRRRNSGRVPTEETRALESSKQAVTAATTELCCSANKRQH